MSSILGIRVVSNAGGINPLACASAIQDAAKKSGIDLNVAVVTGDDILFAVSEFFFFLFLSAFEVL